MNQNTWWPVNEMQLLLQSVYTNKSTQLAPSKNHSYEQFRL